MKYNIIKPNIIYYPNNRKYLETYKIGIHYHRTDGPACIQYRNDKINSKEQETFYNKGKLYKKITYLSNNAIHYIAHLSGKDSFHNESGPAVLTYYNDNLEKIEYYINNNRHRLDGPAVIKYENNDIRSESYYINGIRHREDGPARIVYGRQEHIESYYMNDILLTVEEFKIYHLNKILKKQDIIIEYDKAYPDHCYIKTIFNNFIDMCHYNDLETKLNELLS